MVNSKSTKCLNVGTLKVRSFNSKEKKITVSEDILKYKLHVLAIQETKQGLEEEIEELKIGNDIYNYLLSK